MKFHVVGAVALVILVLALGGCGGSSANQPAHAGAHFGESFCHTYNRCSQ